MGIFDDIGKSISDAGQGAIQKSKEVADVVKYNNVIAEADRQIKEIYIKIGRQYVEDHGDTDEQPYCDYMADVKKLQKDIEDHKHKINAIKGLRQCSACGNTLSDDAKFCTECGAKQTRDA